MSGRLFQALVIGFVLGLGLAGFFHINLWSFIVLLFLLFLGLVWLDKFFTLWLLALAAFCFGVLYFQQDWQRVQQVFSDLPASGTFSGRVISFPEIRNETLVFKVQTMQIEQGTTKRSYKALFLVTTARQADIHYGDLLTLTGRTFKDSSKFTYLAKENAAAELSFPEIKVLAMSRPWSVTSFLKNFRATLERLAEQTLPSPTSDFLLALLIGGSYRLPSELQQDFNATGTQHIMAVSGFNTSIIAFALLALLRRISRNGAIIATFAVLLLFVLLTGASPSVVRAAIMTAAALLGLVFGRPRSGVNLLLLAGLVMLLFNPWLLLYDLGFQLSFLSTYGLLIILPKLAKWSRFLPIVGDVALPGLTAVMMTWPLVSLEVGRISLVAILANAVITPLIPLSMLIGALTLLIAWLGGRLVLTFLPISWGLLNFIFFLVHLLASIPGSLVYLKLSGGLVLTYYAVLLLILHWPKKWRAGLLSSLS
jgi:competence protein ComEC